MAGIGTLITAAEYNNIQSKVNGVLGIGSGDSGYAQTLVSGQVLPGDKIRVGQWLNLRTDLLKARQHQTGNDESAGLTIPTTSLTVSESLRAQYDTFADDVITNRASVGAGQTSLETLISSSISNWNGVRTCTVTATFPNANVTRAFFNAGGNFQISSSRSGGGSNSKNDTWTLMLSQSGAIVMDATSTISTGSSPGTVYSMGFFNLTTSNQVIYWKPAPAGNYAENDYYVYARKSADGTQVIFTSEFRDDDIGDHDPSGDVGLGPYGGPVDEDVTGTTTNTIQIVRPTGSNVSIAAPGVSQTGF